MTEALSSLYERVRRETALRFPGQEDGLVFSCGQAEGCTAVLIGEAPGEQEVKMKRPFSGKAGKNLDEFLHLSGIEREKLFITNTVKLRPSEAGPTGRVRNRAPNRQELDLFIPFLLEELKLVSPPLCVTLGNTPLKALLGSDKSISSCHGQLFKTEDGLPVYCLYHPAAVIYRRELKAVYEQDVRRLGAYITREELPV